MPPSHKQFLDDSTLERDGELDEAPDPADVNDADAFEELVQNNECFMTATPDQPTIDEVQDVPNAPEERSNHMEAGNSDGTPEVVIDRFPSPSAGAPIPSAPDGISVNGSHEGTQPDSVWSPFVSQCDWLFAHWAKMHAPSLSAVSDLLAIPEVWTLLDLLFISLI